MFSARAAETFHFLHRVADRLQMVAKLVDAAIQSCRGWYGEVTRAAERPDETSKVEAPTFLGLKRLRSLERLLSTFAFVVWIFSCCKTIYHQVHASQELINFLVS